MPRITSLALLALVPARSLSANLRNPARETSSELIQHATSSAPPMIHVSMLGFDDVMVQVAECDYAKHPRCRCNLSKKQFFFYSLVALLSLVDVPLRIDLSAICSFKKIMCGQQLFRASQQDISLS